MVGLLASGTCLVASIGESKLSPKEVSLSQMFAGEGGSLGFSDQ